MEQRKQVLNSGLVSVSFGCKWHCMKLLQFKKKNDIRLGVKTDLGILDVKEAAQVFKQSVPETLQELIAQSEEGIAKISNVVERSLKEGHQDLFTQEEAITFAPAVANPEKIICVGLNYVNHAKESKMEVPASPILFSKFNNTLNAHKEPVAIPAGAEKIDYEAELVLVVGKTAKNVSEEEALSYIFGYCAGNDISARDWQFKSGQGLLGKALMASHQSARML